MAEKEEKGSSGPINNDFKAGTESTQSPEDENSESPAPQYSQDLKSVLVTSVLNLEKLDVDLYRY